MPSERQLSTHCGHQLRVLSGPMGTAGRISRSDMMERLLAACPSFAPQWEDFLSEWVGDPILFENGGDGSLPMYLALGDLANHLIKQLEAGQTEEFPATFAVVERWIQEGDDYVSEAAVVGLLEDLTAAHRYTVATPNDFLTWLGPQSRKWWIEVIDFWKRLDSGKFRRLSID